MTLAVRRLLTALVASAGVALLGAYGAAGAALPRSTVDRPDDFAGLQVHMVYAVPSDRVDRSFDTDGSIQNGVDSFQRWLSGQTGGRTLRIDTYQGLADITFLRMSSPDGPFPHTAIIQDLVTAGLNAPGKVYGVYYDGGGLQSQCGGAAWPQWPEPADDTVAGMYLGGLAESCYHGFPLPGEDPNYTVFAMFHDVTHTFGIVGRCAPHYYEPNPAHVGDSSSDFMWGGTTGWMPTTLDVGHDDYYLAGIPGCVDLSTVGFLTSPTSSTVEVAVEGGPGKVTSSPWPLIECGARCSAPYPTGTVIALNAQIERDSTFEGWSGPCSGTGTCMVTVDSLEQVTARFRPADRTVYVYRSGTGEGTITSRPAGLRCPGPCESVFPDETTVSLKATPRPGSRFAGWSSDCSGLTCDYASIDADKIVDAKFVDVRAPQVRALPSAGARGGHARLRYRVNENTGVAQVTIRVGRQSVHTRFRRLAATRIYGAVWRVSRSALRGKHRFCVRASDRSRNTSRWSCAALTVR